VLPAPPPRHSDHPVGPDGQRPNGRHHRGLLDIPEDWDDDYYLAHLPSDIDILRRYPFTIDLERGSASLRAPAAVKAVQLTPAHPVLQVSDNSPPTLSIGKGQRLQQPLPEGAPRYVQYTEVRRGVERSPTAHTRKPPVPKPAGAATLRACNDAVHPRQDTSRPDRVKLARALAKNSNDENLCHWKGRCHPGDCALNQDHTPPSGAEGSAVKRAPKPSGPYTIPKVLASVATNPQPPSGPKTLRAQANDLRPYRVPEAPANLVNVCRMPNQRASPAPTGMTSVRLQLRRRLSGQADLARAARQAARQLQERLRRSPRPRPPQEVATTQPPHCRRKTPTTPPPEAESTTPAPTTDQTLDLEWEIVDEVDAALTGMGSPAALPPARRTDPDSHTTRPNLPRRSSMTGRSGTKGRQTANAVSTRKHPESLCWRCGVPRHSRGACRAPAVLFCFRCGTIGLMSKDCPCPRTPAAPLHEPIPPPPPSQR
jgi:hypothetical protein